MGPWKEDGSPSGSSGFAVPLTHLKSRLPRLLARGRAPDSYIAGGIGLKRDGPRFSADIDIFQDGDERLVAISEADAAVLVEREGEATQLE